LAWSVWGSFARIRLRLLNRPLPELVSTLGTKRRRTFGLPPRRLGVAVQKSLTVAGRSPRCLLSSLVLFDLLRGDGKDPALVIGLPESPASKDAHAWIELDGVDVGPPPGRGRHQALARYEA
jgi:hypothetical protein